MRCLRPAANVPILHPGLQTWDLTVCVAPVSFTQQLLTSVPEEGPSLPSDWQLPALGEKPGLTATTSLGWPVSPQDAVATAFCQ